MTTTRPLSSTAERLHDAGLRSTAPRRAALEALAPGGHLDASEIFEAVKSELPGTSLQAVYGVLGALTEAGLVRKIEPGGSAARYEARVGDNHHHMVCRECGRIEDVQCAIGAAPCLVPSEDHGFTVEAAEVTFLGTCPDCRAADAAGAAETDDAGRASGA
ncbi:transcriptional repressor [Leucobacter sp. CSA1]|uniref:Transcriptional repressor n=1 Tax=Leucobacter chromiisoli TaxID=2796471 RepID=A0A934Q620_9MICO|nr:Fur family transcriptional regulator [Leucobacter chromiisoli]MBK0417706.1 transcriptional repressor [Leucobacter chromiisoli]